MTNRLNRLALSGVGFLLFDDVRSFDKLISPFRLALEHLDRSHGFFFQGWVHRFLFLCFSVFPFAMCFGGGDAPPVGEETWFVIGLASRWLCG
jgi:hypothetical protein